MKKSYQLIFLIECVAERFTIVWPTSIFVFNQEILDETINRRVPATGSKDLNILKFFRSRVSRGKHFLPADGDWVDHIFPHHLLTDYNVDPFSSGRQSLKVFGITKFSSHSWRYEKAFGGVGPDCRSPISIFGSTSCTLPSSREMENLGQPVKFLGLELKGNPPLLLEKWDGGQQLVSSDEVFLLERISRAPCAWKLSN